MYGKVINCLREAGGCAGSSTVKIKVAIPETLCKTNLYLYRQAAANETRNVDGCFFEAPASAKQAGVLHTYWILIIIISEFNCVSLRGCFISWAMNFWGHSSTFCFSRAFRIQLESSRARNRMSTKTVNCFGVAGVSKAGKYAHCNYT